MQAVKRSCISTWYVSKQLLSNNTFIQVFFFC